MPLGEWVLREACDEAARWPEPITVAVNLSPVQFRNRGLVTTVAAGARRRRGLPPHRLELEITESVLLQDDEATLAMLHQLRALGVRIAMDDFGTGYSSLSYLRAFPFDKIKIDRSFIKDIDRNRDSAAIIRRDREPWREPRHRDDRRRRRDRGAARDRAPRRLHRDAGLSGKPAAPGRRGARPHRALPARGACCGVVAQPAAFRKHAGHRQSSPDPSAGIGRRKSSSEHQHLPTVLPHSNAAPQRAQVRGAGFGGGRTVMRRL